MGEQGREMPAVPRVTVVVPARDAEATLGETLDSLGRQTTGDWEAVVVDDGSTDGTADVVARRAAADPRIRLVAGGGVGVSSARNRGLAAATGDLVLFLDADDLLEPEALACLAEALEDPAVDAAHGGWARFWDDGSRDVVRFGPADPDLFPALARAPAFAVHACMLRRGPAEAAGGFDPSMTVCEDWDLWLRLARGGARFRRVDRLVALYRVRRGSLSLDAPSLLDGARRVIALAHGTDPRVPAPVTLYERGLPETARHAAELGFAAWAAGVALSGSHDPVPLVTGLPAAPAATLGAHEVAETLHASLTVGADGARGAVAQVLHGQGDRVDALLTAIEERAMVPYLAARARRRLDRLAAEGAATAGGPARAGATWAASWELTGPPPQPPPGVDRAVLSLAIEAAAAGTVEVPVIDGRLDAGVLADALPDAAVWGLLGAALGRWVVPDLAVRPGPGGATVARGGVVLAEGLSEADLEPAALHDRIGWTLLLQETWGRRWVDFYPAVAEVAAAPSDGAVVAVEIADGVAPGRLDAAPRGPVWVAVSIAGAGLARIPVLPSGGVIDGDEIVAAATLATGFELCRAVVREALVGRPVDEGPRDIRERLREARARRDAAGPPPASTLVLGRRGGPPGSPSWRRATLPPGALRDLQEAARAAGEPVEVTPAGDPVAGVYAPGVLTSGHAPRPDPPPPPSPADGEAGPSPFGGLTSSLRADFEALFASGADPWRYETPYERRKYEQTFGLITAEPVGRALEIGCAEGHFTALLAGAAREVVATDISAIALERARARVDDADPGAAVEYLRLDLHQDPLPEGFDVIVASEVLYYLPDLRELAAAMRRMRDALRPGGRLVCAHANLLADDPDRTGFDWEAPFGARRIGEAMAATPGLSLEAEVRTELYRVQVARRVRRGPLAGRRRPPRIMEEDAVWPEGEVAAAIRRGGGRSAASAPRQRAVGVPILMYHRVAADGPAALARWRVTPAALDEQLAALAELGYRGVGLERWAADLGRRRAPGGRLVAVTFDDAYTDVATHALPLLERHGLPATVFVPTDHVGGTSDWDARYGEPAPLMDWDALGELVARGVTIGSHAASHRPLTALSHDEVAIEVARSRAALEDRLGVPVRTLAYPYGDQDPVVRHLAGAAGIDAAVTVEARPSRIGDDPMAMPRVEVEGGDRLEDLVRKIG